MNKEFKKEFKSLKKEDIANFINSFAKKEYEKPLLIDGFYKIALVENDGASNTDYTFSWKISYNNAKEVVLLAPFEAYGSECDAESLTLSWKKHLYKNCPNYIKAYLDNAEQKASKLIKQAKTELDELSK